MGLTLNPILRKLRNVLRTVDIEAFSRLKVRLKAAGNETSRAAAKKSAAIGLAQKNPGYQTCDTWIPATSSSVNLISMIIQVVSRARGPISSLRNGVRLSCRVVRPSRRFSTSSSSPVSSSAPQSQASMLATITTDLDKIAPKFEIQPDQIDVLKTPVEFFETLKVSHTLHLHPYLLNAICTLIPITHCSLYITSVNVDIASIPFEK